MSEKKKANNMNALKTQELIHLYPEVLVFDLMEKKPTVVLHLRNM